MRPICARAALALAMGLAVIAPAMAAEHYTMQDYGRVQKIDVHMHLHSDQPGFVQHARREKFKLLTINTDYADFPSLDEQQRVAAQLLQAFPADVAFAVSFPVDQSDQPGWLEQTEARISRGMQRGAVGVKIWKNVGMDLRSADGRLVMVDDARFEPLFRYLAEMRIPLLGHQGEPKNCWLPLEEMTVENDREYFKAHPQYHMALHPEMPSYEQQMAARDRMLEHQPGLQFIGMHLASLEWDVDRLAQFLDRFPTAMVDLAARVGQLQDQSNRDRERVRRFFIRYQDRVMYGSDLSQDAKQPGAEFAKEAHAVWRQHWRYFNTDSTMKVAELSHTVRGLALPKSVVDKLYRLNAQRIYPTAWPQNAKRRNELGH